MSAIFCRNCYISVELVPQKGFFSNINPRVSFSFSSSSKSKPVKVSSKSLIRGLQIFSHQNTLESSTSCPATHPRSSQPALKNYPILQMLECEDEEILWMATDCFKSRDARVCASLHVCIMDIEGVGYPSLVAHTVIFQPQSDKRRRILKVHTSGAI